MSHAAAEPQQPEAEAPVAPTGSSAPPASDWLHRYTAALQRGRNLVILAWIAIIVAGLAGTTFVFQNLQLQVRASRGAGARAGLRRARGALARQYLLAACAIPPERASP